MEARVQHYDGIIEKMERMFIDVKIEHQQQVHDHVQRQRRNLIQKHILMYENV
jgi:hypothetical protein